MGLQKITFKYYICIKIFYPTKAAAWARPSQGQALFDGFGLAWVLRKPKPAQAKPKPRLSGQAGPEQPYTRERFKLKNSNRKKKNSIASSRLKKARVAGSWNMVYY